MTMSRLQTSVPYLICEGCGSEICIEGFPETVTCSCGMRYFVQSFPIWTNTVIDLPLWSSGAWSTRTTTLKWTLLNSAKLIIMVQAVAWPSWAALYLNGNKVYDFDFRLGSGTVTTEIDVMNHVRQGSNEFLFDISKISWTGWGPYTLTVNLVLDGDYEDPTPPREPWPTWWPYAAIGGGLATVGIVLAMKGKW